jgi:uncharacterized protein (TIGR00730 family)
MTDQPPHKHTSEMQYNEEPAHGFNVWDPKVLNKIDELVHLAGVPDADENNGDLVREIIVTALKAHHSQLDRGDVKILNRALRELRYGFRIFKPYRERRKVTIFGSARTQPKNPEYKMAKSFAQRMTKEDFMVITGAGPGIMQAGNDGAGKGNSFGVNIRLPFEQHANEFISKDTLFIDCRFFFTRKLMFLKETSAVALFPGGFGTHDEGMEVLTLVQTGKADPMPIVMLERPGDNYWEDWKRYVTKHLLKKGKVSPEDMNLFKVTDSVDAAVREIAGFYHNYHSLRYVKDRLVIRLQRAPSPKLLDSIRNEFKEISVKGTNFEVTGAYPEEKDHRDLPRLSFGFNRFNFGHLRHLIDVLNEE